MFSLILKSALTPLCLLTALGMDSVSKYFEEGASPLGSPFDEISESQQSAKTEVVDENVKKVSDYFSECQPKNEDDSFFFEEQDHIQNREMPVFPPTHDWWIPPGETQDVLDQLYSGALAKSSVDKGKLSNPKVSQESELVSFTCNDSITIF